MGFYDIRRKIIEKEFGFLNGKQKEAVFTTDGPLLILAGAGSGKTTVLINRIYNLIKFGKAYNAERTVGEREEEIFQWYLEGEIDELPPELEEMLCEDTVRPYNILAITFTNKAAAELKTRLSKKLGDCAEEIWASTFHSMCVKILRRFADRIGYETNFIIFDAADQQTVIKDCLNELNFDSKQYTPRAILSNISRAKDQLISPQEYEDINGKEFYGKIVSRVYALYQEKLRQYNAFDFDDLIGKTVELFEKNSDVLEYYRNKFKYILVDEYQDTNHAQYRLVSLLAGKYRNLCVVGDDDQSIYKFRGADIGNILGFEDEFPDAKVIKLEENYRSTQNILNAANSVIRNNRGRKGKELWTENGEGEKITVFRGENEHNEAYFVADSIKKIYDEGGSFNDCVILYRTNAQSRVLEDVLLRSAIPYRVLGGLRFFDRKEIKDITAYLRLIQNTNDDVALKRIINEPKRGIGDASVDKMEEIARENTMSIFDVCRNVMDFPELSRAQSKIIQFADMIDRLIELKNDENLSLEQFVEEVMDKTGIVESYKAEKTVESETRIENLKEFISMVQESVRQNSETTLESLLEDISLISDIDNYDESQETVTLMTLHSAKGLEFPYVFLVGMEENLFPSPRAIGESDELEEEIRLCYVGITRAKKRLFLTAAKVRNIYGSTRFNLISRFIDEIPDDYVEFIEEKPKKTAVYGEFDHISVPEFEKVALSFGQTQSKEKKAGAPSFNVGDKVKHRKFGVGIIKEAKAMGEDMFLSISFEEAGDKKLMAAYANLEKVE